MKITRVRLRQIIREEVSLLTEQPLTDIAEDQVTRAVTQFIANPSGARISRRANLAVLETVAGKLKNGRVVRAYQVSPTSWNVTVAIKAKKQLHSTVIMVLEDDRWQVEAIS